MEFSHGKDTATAHSLENGTKGEIVMKDGGLDCDKDSFFWYVIFIVIVWNFCISSVKIGLISESAVLLGFHLLQA